MINQAREQRKCEREEIVVLVTEYFRTKKLSASQIDESYHRISKFLRKREEMLTGHPVDDVFRNYAGIRIQSGRINCLDSETNLSGMQGTKLQKEIVLECLGNPQRMLDEMEGIYKKYNER